MPSPNGARTAQPPKSLARIDARMVFGLPDSPENLEWFREALAALQAADARPDVDIAGIGERLEAIEARLAALEAKPDVDLSALWDAVAALKRQINALEAAPIPPAEIITRDPLDPSSWDTLIAAKAALEVLVTQEAARRCGHEVELYELMVRLDALGDQRTADEDLQLLQHQGWARERNAVELARLEHNQRIRALTELAAAMIYDWKIGWPLTAREVGA